MKIVSVYFTNEKISFVQKFIDVNSTKFRHASALMCVSVLIWSFDVLIYYIFILRTTDLWKSQNPISSKHSATVCKFNILSLSKLSINDPYNPTIKFSVSTKEQYLHDTIHIFNFQTLHIHIYVTSQTLRKNVTEILLYATFAEQIFLLKKRKRERELAIRGQSRNSRLSSRMSWNRRRRNDGEGGGRVQTEVVCVSKRRDRGSVCAHTQVNRPREDFCTCALQPLYFPVRWTIDRFRADADLAAPAFSHPRRFLFLSVARGVRAIRRWSWQNSVSFAVSRFPHFFLHFSPPSNGCNIKMSNEDRWCWLLLHDQGVQPSRAEVRTVCDCDCQELHESRWRFCVKSHWFRV